MKPITLELLTDFMRALSAESPSWPTTRAQLVISEICGTNRDATSWCVTRKHRQM